MDSIKFCEVGIEKLDEYDKIPFYYDTDTKYELKKVDNGLGGILLELVDVPHFHKDFGERSKNWKMLFDLFNWKLFVAFNGENQMVGGSIVVTRTPNCNMLEGREDLAVLWDLRVKEEYRHQGVGQKLFDMAKNYAQKNGFKQLKVECQNTNPAAVNFYHKQGMELCGIYEHAYPDCPKEVQLLWYLNL